MNCNLTNYGNLKILRSKEVNYIFDKENGTMVTWGETLKKDAEYSPYGPFILDIEISTICNQGCKFCYKGNTSKGKNMSLETFKKLFSKFPENLTQIAFGIGSIESNPDLWKILWYTRNMGIVPNLTINGYGMDSWSYDKLADVCGAVAVSLYDYDTCFNAVAELTKRGMKQVNIHCMLSEETSNKCMAVQLAKEQDDRLKDLNAIVYLRLKPKGRGEKFHQIDPQKYKLLINRALIRGIPIGFDSCSAPSFAEVIKIRADKDEIMQYVEPCESCCFSYYINVEGIGFPCSFSEGTKEYKGVDVLNCSDFMEDVWFGREATSFRNAVANNTDSNGCRNCPVYNLK